MQTQQTAHAKQQHMGKGALPVSMWSDIMPLCQSDVQATVISEKNVCGNQVTLHTHAHGSTYRGTQRWRKAFCLPLQFLIDIILSSWFQILA